MLERKSYELSTQVKQTFYPFDADKYVVSSIKTTHNHRWSCMNLVSGSISVLKKNEKR